MTLFQAPISKSMRLEEFEQAQGQASSQVLKRKTALAFVSLYVLLTHKTYKDIKEPNCPNRKCLNYWRAGSCRFLKYDLTLTKIPEGS